MPSCLCLRSLTQHSLQSLHLTAVNSTRLRVERQQVAERPSERAAVNGSEVVCRVLHRVAAADVKREPPAKTLGHPPVAYRGKAEKSPRVKCVQTAKNFAKFLQKGASGRHQSGSAAEAFQVPHSTAVNRKAPLRSAIAVVLPWKGSGSQRTRRSTTDRVCAGDRCA